MAKSESDGRKRYQRGGQLLMESDRTGDPKTLMQAILVLGDAAAMLSPKFPPYALCLSDFGTALRNQAEQTGDADRLGQSLEVGRRAVEAALGSGIRALCQSNLGVSLQVGYELTGNLDDLIESAEVLRAAVDATPHGNLRLATRLSYLGATLKLLHERTGSMPALAEAIAVLQRAVDVGPAAEQAGHLGNLAAGWGLQFKRTGDLAARDQAIRYGEMAARAARAARDEGDQRRYAESLSKLAVTYGHSYQWTGDLADQRACVELNSQTVAADDDGNVRTVVYLSNLGAALFILAEHTEEIDPLRRAVQAHRATVAAAAPGAPLRWRFQYNLATALGALYNRADDADALAEALAVAGELVHDAPGDIPERADYLSCLGGIQLRWYRRTGQRAALEQAVATMRDSVAGPGGPDPRRLSNLASAVRTLADLTGELADLQEAVQLSGQALEAANSPDRPLLAGKHGMSLIAWFERTGDRTALSDAQRTLAGAAYAADAEIRTRINAGLGLARACTLAGDHEPALAAVTETLALLPRVAPRALRRQDRERRLGQVAGIAGQAAACALSAGRDPGYAVQLLEQARGLLIGETMGARGDLRRLARQNPDLAAEFSRRRGQLAALQDARFDSAEPRSPQHLAAARNAAARDEADAALDALIARIRREPGFAGFLAVPPLDELRWQASAGPIVMVTTAPDRGDALILTADPARPVRHVALRDQPDAQFGAPVQPLTSGRVSQQAHEFLRASAAGDEDAIHRILDWLWDSVTGPVLAELGYGRTPAPGQPWPRLWWCPVGPMAFLPLHAAGRHRDAVPRSVLDVVVSSYTATVRALGYADQAEEVRPGSGTALIVAMPDTPGLDPLPGAEREAQSLRRLLPGARLAAGPDATRDRVLAELPGCPVAHFACHGASNWADPGASRLFLHDHAENPLTVATISALELPDARLAYLSACETSQVSPDLADESVHIGTAFQLAGYRAVIGTLYPVHDAAARRIAFDVYDQLTAHGSRPPETSQAAQALHHAVRRLRDDDRGRPSWWACHAHSGR